MNIDDEMCEVCHQSLAEWFYMPFSDPDRPSAFCDECVPRGCSCNLDLKDDSMWDDEEYQKDPKNWVEELDEKGRRYPCCEFMYDPK